MKQATFAEFKKWVETYYASLTEETWKTIIEEDADWNYAILGHGVSENASEQSETEVIDSEH